MVITTQFESLCHALLSSPLRLVCSALVSQEMCKRYKSRYMIINDPYTIFQLEGQNTSYVVVFGYLEMSVCQTIRLTDLHNILCENEYNVSRNLFFTFSHRMCYNQSMKLTSDLREHCGAKGYGNDSQSGYYFVNDADQKELVLVQSDCGCGLLGSPTLVLCLLLSLVLVVCLRWRVEARL